MGFILRDERGVPLVQKGRLRFVVGWCSFSLRTAMETDMANNHSYWTALQDQNEALRAENEELRMRVARLEADNRVMQNLLLSARQQQDEVRIDRREQRGGLNELSDAGAQNEEHVDTDGNFPSPLAAALKKKKLLGKGPRAASKKSGSREDHHSWLRAQALMPTPAPK